MCPPSESSSSLSLRVDVLLHFMPYLCSTGFTGPHRCCLHFPVAQPPSHSLNNGSRRLPSSCARRHQPPEARAVVPVSHRSSSSDFCNFGVDDSGSTPVDFQPSQRWLDLVMEPKRWLRGKAWEYADKSASFFFVRSNFQLFCYHIRFGTIWAEACLGRVIRF